MQFISLDNVVNFINGFLVYLIFQILFDICSILPHNSRLDFSDWVYASFFSKDFVLEQF